MTEAHRLLVDLHGEFARGRHDERHRPVALLRDRLRAHVHEERQQVSERLARARLGEPDQVEAAHGHGPRLALDGSRRMERGRCDRVEHVLREGRLHEAAHWVGAGPAVHPHADLAAHSLGVVVRECGDRRMLEVVVTRDGGQHVGRRGGEAASAAARASTRRLAQKAAPRHCLYLCSTSSQLVPNACAVE